MHLLKSMSLLKSTLMKYLRYVYVKVFISMTMVEATHVRSSSILWPWCNALVHTKGRGGGGGLGHVT